MLTLGSSTARAGSSFQVQVTVSDGLQTTTRTFTVTLSTPAPQKQNTPASVPLGRPLLARSLSEAAAAADAVFAAMGR